VHFRFCVPTTGNTHCNTFKSKPEFAVFDVMKHKFNVSALHYDFYFGHLFCHSLFYIEYSAVSFRRLEFAEFNDFVDFILISLSQSLSIVRNLFTDKITHYDLTEYILYFGYYVGIISSYSNRIKFLSQLYKITTFDDERDKY